MEQKTGFLSFRLDDDFVEVYRDRDVEWGFSNETGFSLGEMVFLTNYSRAKEDGSKERWWEVVKRVVEGTFTTLKNHCLDNGIEWDEEYHQNLAEKMYERIFTFKFLPPGRGLFCMGTSLIHEHGLGVAANSCGFTSTVNLKEDSISPFTYLMDFSMLGVGVGFDVFGADTVRINEPTDGVRKIKIADSRQGWVRSTALLFGSYLKPNRPKYHFDYSGIRDAGEPIKTFGGISSGAAPLIHLHDKIREIFEAHKGQMISSRLVADFMNLIGKCIVSGNVRRTAEIMFGSKDDDDFLSLKDYTLPENAERTGMDGWSWTSNDSVVLRNDEKIDFNGYAQMVSRNGEPGLFWIDRARQYGRTTDAPDYRDMAVMGGNPCITKDTVVFTSEGPKKVESLINRPYSAVVDNFVYPSYEGFFETGCKSVYRLNTKEGHSVSVTEDHQILTAPKVTPKKRYEKFVRAGELQKGDRVILNNNRAFPEWGGLGTKEEGWLLGELLGDGHFHHSSQTAKVQFWGEHKAKMLDKAKDCIEALGGSSHYHSLRTGTTVAERDMCSIGSKRLWEVAEKFGVTPYKEIANDDLCVASSDFQSAFIRGLFDADGSVQGSTSKGVSLRLSSVTARHLEIVQKMMMNFGIVSFIYYNRDSGGRVLMPNGKGGSSYYDTAPRHELIVASDNIGVFAECIGFNEPDKIKALDSLLHSYIRTPNRERFVATFDSLEYLGEEAVYDCTVEDVHRFSANGVVVHNCMEQSLHDKEICNLVETFPYHHDSLEDYFETLNVAFLYAKAVTLLPIHREETARIVKENRRIGTSMSGVVQFLENRGEDELKRWMDEGYEHIQYVDDVISDQYKINRSIKTTSIKPSGSVSLLSNATPGVHWPVATTYIRRKRFSWDDPVLHALREANYRIEPAFGSSDTTAVVEIPIRIEKMRSEPEVGVEEKIRLAALAQDYWADNQVSVTATFHPRDYFEKPSDALSGNAKYLSEVDALAKALEEYEPHLKAISCLPIDPNSYPQLPYEAISDERYEQEVSRLGAVDIDSLYNSLEDAEAEKGCTSDKCEI